ncbi:hypothetical protein ACSG67_004800 [Salmonella enterica subsp. enterica serovar Muenchen]
MPLVFLAYALPTIILVVGIYSLFSSRVKGKTDKTKTDAAAIVAIPCIVAALIGFCTVIYLIGTPSEIIKSMADKEAYRNELIKTCKMVESGRNGGILTGKQDGYLCKDGVVHFISSRK